LQTRQGAWVGQIDQMNMNLFADERKDRSRRIF
jgi:hypothetical protein